MKVLAVILSKGCADSVGQTVSNCLVVSFSLESFCRLYRTTGVRHQPLVLHTASSEPTPAQASHWTKDLRLRLRT